MKAKLTNAQRVWLYSKVSRYERMVMYEIATALDLHAEPEPMRKTAKRCGLTRVGFSQIVCRLARSGELIVHGGGGRGRYNRYELGEALQNT